MNAFVFIGISHCIVILCAMSQMVCISLKWVVINILDTQSLVVSTHLNLTQLV